MSVTVPRSHAAAEPASTSSMCSGRMPIVNASSPSSALRGCTVTGRAPSTGIVSTRSSPVWSSVVGRKFIIVEPTNPATKRLAGWL